MSPLSWLFAATFLDLVQGVQDKDGLRVISALGEVSSQAVNHGKACWAQCGSLGSCPGFCGDAGACCRMGIGKESECSAGGSGCTKKACCVKSATVGLDKVGSVMLENKDPDTIKQEDKSMTTKLEEIELQNLQEVSTSAANAAKQAALAAGMTSDKASEAAVKAGLQAAADAEKKGAGQVADAAVGLAEANNKTSKKAAVSAASTSKANATASLSLKKDTANVTIAKQLPSEKGLAAPSKNDSQSQQGADANVAEAEAKAAARKTNKSETGTPRTLPRKKPTPKHTTPVPASESAAPGASKTLEPPKDLENPTVELAKKSPKTNLTLQVPMPGTNKTVALNLTVSLNSTKTGSDVKLTDAKTLKASPDDSIKVSNGESTATAAPGEEVTGTTPLPEDEVSPPVDTSDEIPGETDVSVTTSRAMSDQDLPFTDDMPNVPPPKDTSKTEEPEETLGLDDVQNEVFVPGDTGPDEPLGKRLATLDGLTSQEQARMLYSNAFPTVKEKLIYLHNAFRCLHAAPPLVWDGNLESDMKSAISGMSWTMEKGISGLPNKTGVVAINIFWNAGDEAPRPEESVSAWYEQCDNCTGGCSGFADGCPSSPTTPTTQFRNVVRTDVAKVACVTSADSKTLLCFYSTDDTARVADVSPRVKLTKACHAAAALSFTKKLLCVTSSTNKGQAQKAATLQMQKCTYANSQSLIIRRGMLEFKDPGGTCVTVGPEKQRDGCQMVTLETCNDESKYQQFRAWKVDAYGDNEQELWKNPATNTTLGIRKRKIWSCTEASKIPFLRLR